MSRSDQPRFEAALVGALAEAGLRGSVGIVRLEGDTLGISGEEGGELAIPARQVERIRLVKFAGSRLGTSYEAEIRRRGATERLLLIAPRPAAGYGPVIKGFAGQVADLGGLVMRGPGRATALVNLLLTSGSVSLLAAGALLLAVFQGGWLWWLAAAIGVLIALLLLRHGFRDRWPRRVHDLDELDRELPPDEERLS